MQGARRRSFVGRSAELALFREALRAEEPSACVLWLFGPAGVGKSTLLAAFADAASEAGREPVLVDLRGLEPSPPAFEAELARLGSGGERPVLLIDTFEGAVALEDWLRDTFLPELPAGSLIVIAGRTAPSPAWRRDPGWRELLRVVSLRNLDRDDARLLLPEEAVDPAMRERILDVTHGHPLALALLLDAVSQDRELAGEGGLDLASVPDVVAALMRSFIDAVPSREHRLALAAAAQARFTTAPILRRLVGDERGDAMFAWLQGLSFMEPTPNGLCPHDLARDVVDADLRWRDPQTHAEVHARVREVVIEASATAVGRARQRALADLMFLHRSNPAAPALWDWESLGRVYAEPMGRDDRAAVLAMVRRHDGTEAEAIAAHWMELRPEGFTVFRERASDVVGFHLGLDLHTTTEQERAADPGAVAAWEHAQRHAPVRPLDEVAMGRMFMDRDVYQEPSRSLNVVTILSTQEWLSRPRLAWYFLVLAIPPAFEPMMAYIHFDRARDADFEVGGRRFATFARDWRREGVVAWLERMGELELATEPPPAVPRDAAPPMLAMSRRDFAAAVRSALRDLHRAEALAASPLLRSRLVDDAPASSLRDIIEDAVAALGRHPKTAKLARAVECTYLRPAPTQEAAAELLGLPFSTYRGHLARGIDAIVDRLWERELYGA